jgi:hypothetical protein
MRIPVRAVLISSAISLAYSSFVFACPEWTRELGLDVWNTFDEDEQVRINLKRQKELDAVGERVMQRVSLKLEIVRDLVERRITLEHATEQFLALNRSAPELMTVTRRSYPAASDEESVAQQVIGFARNNPRWESRHGKDLLPQLEKELAEITKRHNAVGSRQ